MNLVITMAGLGTRFQKVGYRVPKFMIEAAGRNLFGWSMESLRGFFDRAHFVFVARQADDVSSFLARECRALGIRSHGLVELAAPTDGQATTVMRARDALDPAQPFGIYNIDTFVEPQYLTVDAMPGDGWIPCFPGLGDAWSFARTGESGLVVEVREKVRISPHATVGFYGFGSFELFRHAYDIYYADPARLERGERYVAPLYNQLIADGFAVHLHEIPASGVHPLGTPEEVEAFVAARA